MFSKLKLVYFLSKEANLVYSIDQFTNWFTLQTGDYDIIIEFPVDSRSSKVFRKCNVLRAHTDSHTYL